MSNTLSEIKTVIAFWEKNIFYEHMMHKNVLWVIFTIIFMYDGLLLNYIDCEYESLLNYWFYK